MPPSPAKKSEPSGVPGVPFETAEEAWFWFIAARNAQIDGTARQSRPGAVPRPCEPADILNILTRLQKGRLLQMDHFYVLKQYGERHMRPDPDRPHERASAALWDQAMERLTERFIRHGVIMPPPEWRRTGEKPNISQMTRPASKKRVTRRDLADGLWKTVSTGTVHHAA